MSYPVDRDVDDWRVQVGEFTDGNGNVRECVVRREFADGHGLIIDYWRGEERIKGAEIFKADFRLTSSSLGVES